MDESGIPDQRMETVDRRGMPNTIYLDNKAMFERQLPIYRLACNKKRGKLEVRHSRLGQAESSLGSPDFEAQPPD